MISQPAAPADCTVPEYGAGTYGGLAASGIINKITSTFDSVTNQFSWTANFSSCNGQIPDGYWLVVNNGPNPKGHAGELVIFYFDATDLNNPEMTVYTYNGQNGYNSFQDGDGETAGIQTPDRIHSTLTGDQSFLLEIDAVDEANGTRTLHFKINATTIKQHVPAYPDALDPWYGAGFDDYAGYWFHPVSNASVAYCNAGDQDQICLDVLPGQSSEGFLKGGGFLAHGFHDTNNLPTNEVPICVTTIGGIQAQLQAQKANPKIASSGQFSASAVVDNALSAVNTKLGLGQPQCISVDIDEDFTAAFTGSDGDNDDLTVTYSGFPATSTFVDFNTSNPIASGDVLSQPVVGLFNWTPAFADAGSTYNMTVVVSDDAEGSAQCALDLCVPQDNPPTCDLAISTQNPQCGGIETKVLFDGSGSFDPEGKDIDLVFTTTCVDANGTTESIQSINDFQAELTLTLPGTGVAANCTVTLTVSDIYKQSSSCTVPVSVDPCELDCLSQPLGSAQLDQCGVCNGTNACLDCEGTPNGSKVVDLCGVCGGSNECLDCAGTPFGTAQNDLCGVCNGDNSTCAVCQTTDQTPILFSLDGGALHQKNLVLKATRLLQNVSKTKKDKKFANTAKATAEDLYVANWVNTWSLPQIVTTCENAALFCAASVDNAITIQQYQANTDELRDLGVEAVDRIRKATGKKKARRKLKKQITKLHKKITDASNGVPSLDCIF